MASSGDGAELSPRRTAGKASIEPGAAEVSTDMLRSTGSLDPAVLRTKGPPCSAWPFVRDLVDVAARLR